MKLLGSNQMHVDEAKAARVRQLAFVSILAKKVAMLEKEVTAEEIKTTLFHMKANKALGLMGFLMIFSSSPGQLLVMRWWL